MHMSNHMMPQKKGVCEFFKNAHKFQKISYSGIIPSVYEGKE